MMKNKILLITLLSIMVMYSCTEPFNQHIDAHSDALVVEGMITTEDGPYTVKLMNTIPLNSE